MRTVLILLVASIVASAQEWTMLFDGKTTSGWREITGQPVPTSWTVEEGCLKSVPQEHAWQDIRTEAEFDEFELEFEWKIAPGGNGGVKYLIEKVDTWQSKTGTGLHARARGFEYQIIDNDLHQDARRGPERTTSALYGKVAPQQAECRPVGQFNVSRIVVRNATVEHWLNGRRVLTAPVSVRHSAVSLQHHNSAVWFRSIKVRRFMPGRNRLPD